MGIYRKTNETVFKVRLMALLSILSGMDITPDSGYRELSCDSGDCQAGGEWRTMVGKFVAVNSVTMSCSCDLSPPGMSPYCHLGDGCMDLILVSDCSRREFLKFLMRTAKGEEVRLT